MHKILLSLLLVAGCKPHASTVAQPPPNPPVADTTYQFEIIFGERVAGAITLVRHPDGSFDEDFQFDDRGSGPKTHARFEPGSDGMPNKIEISGHDYRKRPVHEVATCSASRCTWESKDERGEGGRGFYVLHNKSLVANAALLKLAVQPAGAKLLPGGTLRARKVADTTLKRGAESLHVNAYELTGYGFEPGFDWADDDGIPFAQVDEGGSGVRAGWKESVPTLLALQQPLAESRRERVAREVSHQAEQLSVVHARLFDPASKKILENATIIIERGKVKAVGAGLEPSGEVIDATGKTVLPGLWDMHAHVKEEEGLMHLANGVTTVRDLGGVVAAALKRRTRWDAGTELGPRLLLAGFVDGHGPKAGPFEIFADTPEQAIRVVDDYASKGYVQMKIYSSVRPELVPIIVKRAREKGMRVSGHIPGHMTAADAVKAGYDEIQHIEHLMADLIAANPGEPRSAVGTAERAGGVDLKSARVNALLDLLVKHHTVVDPTLNVVEGELTTRRDHPNPTVAPILARLPAQVQRDAVGGALPIKHGLEPQYKESFERSRQLVKLMWDRKIPIVAGTDAWAGFALHRELELYTEAGIPNVDVLAIATLGAATVMNLNGKSGSVAPGKDADLILVDGDPLLNMGDIRRTVTVIKGQTVVDVAAAQRALGIAPQ